MSMSLEILKDKEYEKEEKGNLNYDYPYWKELDFEDEEPLDDYQDEDEWEEDPMDDYDPYWDL